MQGTIVLADAAQTDATGKIHALGVGWALTVTPTPPMALMVLIDCPWDQTNKKHTLVIDLLDADGHPVQGTDANTGQPGPVVHIEGGFEVGRPPGVPAGTPQRQPLSVTLGPGIELTPGEKYEFRLIIDDEPQDSWLSTFMIRPS